MNFRLEDVTTSGMDVLKQFDQRLERAAQALISEEWLEDLVAAGGSPPEILALPNSLPTKEVRIILPNRTGSTFPDSQPKVCLVKEVLLFGVNLTSLS